MRSTTWFAQTGESHVSDYMLPALVLIGVALIWVGMWSLLSRLFSGQSHFLRHVLIAEAVVLAFWLYSELAQFAAFSFTWPLAFNDLYIANWVALAALCFLHLREVGRTHLLAKGIAVALLLVAAVTAQILQRSEAFANSGRQTASHVLLPPGLRLAPLRNETAFFADIGKLRTTVDADRAQARPAAAVSP